MKLLGFCDWWSEVIEYKGQQYKVISFSDKYDSLVKPFPKLITFPELALLSEKDKKEEIEKRHIAWEEYHKFPWKNEDSKKEYEKLEIIRNNTWELLEEVFLKKGWKVPGSEYQDIYIPVILDDEGQAWKVCVGQRTWGDFIYRLECKRKNIKPNDDLGYMYWYLQYGKDNNEKPKYPNKKTWRLQTVKYEKVDYL